ncbi:MAG TPA: HAMP domain-containing sensor histidine kinase [Anaeromyxobacter sp.]|nr:HAMP domain-containing sensor histidine kinase [Anaeromyxobacter sp.]
MSSGILVVACALAVVLAAVAALRARSERDALRRRLDDLERSRDELVACVSHELRTPLNAVLGWARLLHSGRLDAACAARAIEGIERGATAEAQIVDDLLDVARIARGELRLDVRAVDLVPVVEAAVAAVRPAAATRGIALSVALEPKPGAVSGDPGRLQQAVWNLLSNAVKFTPEGGRVEVRLRREGDAAVIRVTDTGEGFDAAFAPHLFERFRQADSSLTRPHGGIGAGLAIVRHVVEAHGGTVSGYSAGRGRGATFTVRLPVARRAVAPGAGAPGPRTAAARHV